MSADDWTEQHTVHLLAHALAMGGWLSADYVAETEAAVAVMDYLIGEGLFRLVDDPTSAPHLRLHLTELGVTVAARLAGVEA